ncbi:MAG: AAA family ATPase [Actinobacteria bacterium]|nr:AAA family ATPase [Actinomycetota bacterium]MCL6104950.1 AAA family ATPase [Actinomycetota bacterium]
MKKIDFFTQSKVLIVAGKGGVGKTTVSAVLAYAVAMESKKALLVEVEPKDDLLDIFELNTAVHSFGDTTTLEDKGTKHDSAALGYEETLLALLPHGGQVVGRVLTADDALVEYLANHGLKKVIKKLLASGVLDVVATAIPGIRDILVLGKIKQLERVQAADSAGLIVVDAPGTGHVMTFLSSSSGLLDAARGGPIRVQAQEVVDMLDDPARCQVILVTLPEEMPINETIEAAYFLEEKVGITLGPVVVNCLYPVVKGLEPDPEQTALEVPTLATGTLAALKEAADFRLKRQNLQEEQLKKLRAELPLPQIHLPQLFTREIALKEIEFLGAVFRDQITHLSYDFADKLV